MVYKKKGAVEGKWEYRGCYKESEDRLIKKNLGNVKNKNACLKLGSEWGYNTIGLSNYGECWADISPAYEKLGAAKNCGMMGTKSTNIVWVKADKKIEFKYMGCFKDDTTRLI